MRLLFTVQYLGTRYGGWQAQVNALSVQQVLEESLAKIFGGPVRVHGAGRTDAGVHARAQRAHADVPFAIPPRGLVLGLNQHLPSDVRITEVEEVAEEFHARFDATGKTYQYRIWNAVVADVFAAETHAHVVPPLDEAAMSNAAQPILGTHDFRAFTVIDPEVGSTLRTIEAISVVREGETLTITVSGDGFLRYMVRRIAGSLIEVGRGRLDPEALRRSLDPSFEAARWTAAAKGLVLLEVRYGSPARPTAASANIRALK
ncbi:MAG: tRNA pseudouridine38-40 synthase [Acidobacteriota bacterium]|jgi:tRNA pseudouridine38-40 synthase|nr:tRNA pseudouridine38-40 synthase [Acidobacteriota bacterium]